MRAWAARPKIEAYLLNPAFCCTTLTATISGYMSVKENGIPFPLMFMILPITLHKPTRNLLPPNTRTSMAAWLQENHVVRVLFYERLISLKPYTKEAFQFGMLFDWITPTSGGLIETTLIEADINRAIGNVADEARECIMRARFLGKWFAKAGDSHTIMAFWGIRP
ncbi:MAG: three component ABC system middle component [bacterium]